MSIKMQPINTSHVACDNQDMLQCLFLVYIKVESDYKDANC